MDESELGGDMPAKLSGGRRGTMAMDESELGGDMPAKLSGGRRGTMAMDESELGGDMPAKLSGGRRGTMAMDESELGAGEASTESNGEQDTTTQTASEMVNVGTTATIGNHRRFVASVMPFQPHKSSKRPRLRMVVGIIRDSEPHRMSDWLVVAADTVAKSLQGQEGICRALSSVGVTLVGESNDRFRLLDESHCISCGELKNSSTPSPIDNLICQRDYCYYCCRSEGYTLGRYRCCSDEPLKSNLGGSKSGAWEYAFKLNGHSGPVYAVHFSPDGKLLASCSRDKKVLVWNQFSGRVLFTLVGHSDWVLSVRFSPDSTVLASASGDNTVRLWDPNSGDPIATLKGHSDMVTSLAFSPAQNFWVSSTLVSGSADGTVGLWDPRSCARVSSLHGHSGAVTAVQFSPDAKILATGSFDNSLILWETSTGRQLRTMRVATPHGHASNIHAINFSPDGKMLASSSSDHSVLLWETRLGQPIATLQGHNGCDGCTCNYVPSKTTTLKRTDCKVVGHSGAVTAVQFSPDGHFLASASMDSTCILWHPHSGERICTLTRHTAPVNAVDFSPCGNYLATASDDGQIIVWAKPGVLLARSLKILHQAPMTFT
jgi:WD40 repeat protein